MFIRPQNLYQEAVINGVLSHREHPNQAWIPFTARELTAKFVKRAEEVPYNDD
jgi:hypothetical protein